MTRINDSLLVQRVDDEIVVMDESSGAEIAFPVAIVQEVVKAMSYLAHAPVATIVPKGVWRHADDGSECASFPDAIDWTFVDKEMDDMHPTVCGHGRRLACKPRGNS